MARARSKSGRACSGPAQGLPDGGEIVQSGTDVRVVGAVGGLGYGQRPLGQRPGLLQLTQIPPGKGEVAQDCSGIWVVGAVGRLIDGQGPLDQRPGRLRRPGRPREARLLRALPTAAWSGP